MDWQKTNNAEDEELKQPEEEREKSSFAAFCRENDDQSRPGRLDQRLKNLVQGYNEDSM